MSLRFNHIVIFAVFAMLTFASCSTEKDAALNVGYHNMTARYNGYFNARVIIEESLEGYRESTTEDFTKLLPLDLYPSKEDIPGIQEKYEDAFERCEKVIFRHSMPNANVTKNKNIEHCRWIDDNWFVIAKIHYTRREYFKAEEIFKFIQESPLYVDQERVHEARIWLAKTYIAKEDFVEAKRYLSMIEIDMQEAESKSGNGKEKESKRDKERRKKQEKKDKKNGVKKPGPFPKQLKDEYELTMAEFHIAKEEYKKAIEHLEKGIELTKKRKVKARYQFVLAQLYEQEGNGDMAAVNFQKVVKSPAPYEMRFQAQIHKALSATTGGDALKKELAKMLRDNKNIEYKDQIYFALAEIAMKEGDIDEAKLNYTRSAFSSVKNDRQKGVSYLALGDLHFEEKDYLSAQKYYDSCVQVLPEEYETYEKIAAKAEGLSGLVENYETFMHEDSVQQIAQLPESDLEEFLEQTLKQIKADEKLKKEQDQARLLAQQNRVKNAGGNAGSGSKWYFYNQKVSSSGFNDYRSNWGQRLLEDDWRRANKTSYTSEDGEEDEDNDSLVVEVDSLTVDVLRAGLPLTKALMDSSQNSAMNSLYMLGIIYKESLKEEAEAILYFKKIIDRNIKHKKVLPALYQLYLIYKKKGSIEAGRYEDAIMNDYGESEIAKILSDPDYLEKKRAKDEEDLNAYSETLEHYRYQRYNNVLARCNTIIATDSTNEYINKYYLLKAFAIGKSSPGNKTAISGPLQKLYDLSPTSEEGIQAKIYLDKLAEGLSIVKPDTTSTAPQSPFTYDIALQHYFILVFPNDAGNINSTKFKLGNFNKEFYKSQRLKTDNALLGSDNSVLIVRKFTNQEVASGYLLAFDSKQAKTSLGAMSADYEHFIINSDNFKVLFDTQDLKGYQDFYREKY
ncbi:MAG: tetratricopeptide (TPR) repeat protein [Arenicella sp.]|jgi:tetratricopeptide (TPR) repeat protein